MKNISNKHCYEIEYREYKKGILDDFVDATYIITMKNSKRIINIEAQLKKYIPTKKIYIVYNNGYKTCNKILPLYKPPYDISDAYFHTLYHSVENKFNNILILEDDFIFSDNINNKIIQNEIKNTLDKNINNKIYFNLGPIPILFYPNINPFNNIYKGIITTMTQGVIYNKSIRNDILKYKDDINIRHNIRHWDVFISGTYTTYFYKLPIIYQTFPQTENQSYWVSDNKKDLRNIICKYLVTKFMLLTKLDIQPEPGFTIIYNIFFALNYLLFTGIGTLIVIYLLKIINSHII